MTFKSILIVLISSASMLLTGCANKEIDINNENYKIGKVVKVEAIETDVNEVSKLINAKAIGNNEDEVELSGSRNKHTLIGGLTFGVVGAIITHGASTALGGNDVDAFKTIVETKNNKKELILPLNLPIGTMVEFEDNEKIEIVKIK